jgi:ribosomal protein S12 methylthiotransferase accessory factor
VRGDVPDSARLFARLAEVGADPDLIVVIELAESGSVSSVRPDALDRIGAHHAHRLGPIRSCGELTRLPLEGPAIHLCQAEWSVGNLRFPTPRHERLAQGSGSVKLAQSVARAEAIERYAAYDLSFARLVPARERDLLHAIDRRALYVGNDRQQAALSADVAEPGERSLWCAAAAGDGSQAWVPADAVYLTLPPPRGEPTVAPTSSGVAAHSDLRKATERALCELVERDAFMWTWVQRVSRERVAPETVPADVASWAASPVLAARVVSWVNLSLETFPVILCAVHGESGLVLGAACHESPAAALRRATVEAITLALLFKPDPTERIDPRAVRAPRDHLLLHRDPSSVAEHEFLYSSDVEIPLAEVQHGGGRSLQDRLTDIGVESLIVDLTSPQCAPFVVVRALAPGLVPLTFGSDCEPLGLPRLARPRRTGDGRTVGTVADLRQLGPIMPHPFP